MGEAISKKETSSTKPKYPGSPSSSNHSFTPQQFLALVANLQRDCREGNTRSNLRDKFQENEISPVILLSVADHLRSKNFVQSLKSLLDPENRNAQAYQFYFGVELNSGDKFDSVCDTLHFRSLFSNTDLLVLYDLDSAKATVQKKLAAKFLEKTVEPITICTISAPPGSRDACSFANELASFALHIHIPNLTAATLTKWIESQAKPAGSAEGITAEGASKLAEIFGNDPVSIYQELQKLALITPRDKPIDLEMITKVCAHQPEMESLALVQSMARRNLVQSSLICRRLLDQGQHPLQLSSFLSLSFRLLFSELGRSKLMNGRKSSVELTASELNKPWMMAKLQSIKSLYTLRDLRLAIQTLKELDFSLKNTGIDAEVATALAVWRIAARKFE